MKRNRNRVRRSVLTSLPCALALGLGTGTAHAIHVSLQNGTAVASQGGFNASNLINDVYPANTNSAGDGWADVVGGVTSANTFVAETVSDLDLSSGGTVRFNLFQGWSSSHTVGNYRLSYTTDDRSTFADGLQNGGDVTAAWVQITPDSAVSSGGATLTILGDNSILSSGADPNRTTDTITVALGPIAQPITGFRLEALENASLPTNGPGRASNGNFVARELDVAAFQGTKVDLQNGTAIRSQNTFSVDNAIDGFFPFHDAGGVGWANNAQDGNVAAFETVSDLDTPSGFINELTAELVGGGFGLSHVLGKFRISATTDDRSTFADGLDNGGDVTANWTVLDVESIVSDNPGTVFTVDGSGAILASGPLTSIEHYTMTFRTYLSGITGFRLEALEDSSFPANGPGRASNGNFVLREFTVYSNLVPIPEPATGLLGLMGVAMLGRRRQRA